MQRVLGHQRLELGEDLGVAARRQVLRDRQLPRAQPQVLEAPHLGRRERLIGEVRERRAAPQLQRLARAPLPDQVLEAHDVQPVAVELQLVAAPAGDDLRPAPGQHAAQVGDELLDHLGPARR